MPRSSPDDDLLLAARRDPDAFAELYRRHVRAIAGYALRRTGSRELAADVTAETFAAALQHCRAYDPAKGPAIGWLYGIARRQVADALERGAVEDRARRRMRIPPIALDDESFEQVEAAASTGAVAAFLDELPADQRAAVAARVLDEREYPDIATATGTSEAVIRQRVSRGLAGLRARMGVRP